MCHDLCFSCHKKVILVSKPKLSCIRMPIKNKMKMIASVNSRQIVLDEPDFDISSTLDFAMVISFAAFE